MFMIPKAPVRFVLRRMRNIDIGVRLGLSFGLLLMFLAVTSTFLLGHWVEADGNNHDVAATLMLAALVICLIISLSVARSITRPLNELIDVAREMVACDEDFLRQSDARDEIGEITRAAINIQKSMRRVTADSNRLIQAAADGNLSTRVDASLYQAEFRKLVEGVNGMLDTVIDPLNIAAEYVVRVSRGEIPPKITGACEVDFKSIQNNRNLQDNLNRTAEAVNEMIESIAKFRVLEKLENSGRLIRLDYPYRPRRRPWNAATSRIFELLNSGSDRYAILVDQIAAFIPFLERIQVSSDSLTDLAPRWVNGWFPAFDAISLYGLLALNNPRHYVEVGAGHSTMFARQAIKDHGLRTKIISIDPYPRADIDSICDKVVRLPCEEVASEFFDSLTSEDLLFVDNSHRAFPNSDVTVFFSEILPNLPRGLLYGLHDIFLPWDYPDEWNDRYYNEQYLLAAYLLGGGRGDKIVLPNVFLCCHCPDMLRPLNALLNISKLDGIEKTGGAFWIRRG